MELKFGVSCELFMWILAYNWTKWNWNFCEFLIKSYAYNLIIGPSGIEIQNNHLLKAIYLPYNWTKWNWNHRGIWAVRLLGNLIIGPSGIEINLFGGHRYFDLPYNWTKWNWNGGILSKSNGQAPYNWTKWNWNLTEQEIFESKDRLIIGPSGIEIVYPGSKTLMMIAL